MMGTLSYTLSQLAAHVGAEPRGDADLPIQGLAILQEAGPAQLSFLANPQHRKYLPESRAGVALLTVADADRFVDIALVVTSPYLTYASLSHLSDRKPKATAGIHPTTIVVADAEVDPSASVGVYAVIESGARIGAGVSIGAHYVTGVRSVIGEGSWLAPRVMFYHDVTVGAWVSTQSSAVTGGEGSGFANEKGVQQEIAQIDGVTIGDDVEIGADITIDRGALSDTPIGNGVKLDNQIMIAYNVQIGDHTVMVVCVGISNSTKTGRHCMLTGGVGLAGHIEICDNVLVTGMTTVIRSIIEPGLYSSGTAMQSAAEWKKSAACIRQLDDMARRLQQLERRLAVVTSSGDASSDAQLTFFVSPFSEQAPPSMMDTNEICEYLSHHYPFLLVDRVVELDIEGKRIRTYKNVSISEPFSSGHLPEYPIMPGVLIIEAMAQAAGILSFKMLDVKSADGTPYYFVDLDKLRFRRSVLLGDQLQLHAKLISVKRSIWKFDCYATVDDKPVCSAEIICAERKL